MHSFRMTLYSSVKLRRNKTLCTISKLTTIAAKGMLEIHRSMRDNIVNRILAREILIRDSLLMILLLIHSNNIHTNTHCSVVTCSFD